MTLVFDSGCCVRNFVREVSRDRSAGHIYDHFRHCDYRKLFVERFDAACLGCCCATCSNLQYLYVGDILYCVPGGRFGHHAGCPQINLFSSIRSRVVFVLVRRLT